MSKFSIILPVRNGGEYVKDCVNSILAQTFKDFNLIVLENASTDQTLEWLASLKDPRVEIHSSGEALTIEQNWSRILTVPKNDFITLIGHDDILTPNYLETMVQLILKHPGASLYQTRFSYIDAKGKVIRESKEMAEHQTAATFVEKYLRREIDVMGTGFMMRSADYDKVGGIPPYPNLLFADFELWIRLASISYLATAPENTFSFRIHESTTSVSSDIKFQGGFERFVGFLVSLSEKDEQFGKVIHDNAGSYLTYYCQGLSHRLLRTPMAKRNGLSVQRFVNACYDYAKKLGLKDFDPRSRNSIRLAIALDSNVITRTLFLGFKKIYSKPLLR